jgi:predicted membrane protein
MSAPAVFLGLLIASALGFLFHFLRGGRLARLGLYLGTAWVGFFAGHFVGEWWAWRTLRLGSINLFASLLGAIVGLFVASLLAGPERGRLVAARRPHEDDDEG